MTSNLTSRSDGAQTETFTYDVLNRLTNGTKQGAITYAANGNITSKLNVGGSASGTYTYDANKPHAVATAFGYTHAYDANGNLTSRSKGTEAWALRYTGFDKPRWMTKTDGPTTVGSEFLYNANRSRVIQLEYNTVDGSGVPSHYVRKRVYGLGPVLEANYDNAAASGAADWKLKKVRLYVTGPDGMIGAREFDVTSGTAGTEQALVYHHDHLGSTQSITPWGVGNALAANATGESGRYSEDPWGARRNPFTWTGVPPANTDNGGAQGLTPRGFTGHEMLDDLGFVHMNGRIYDPLLGRFLSADIQVQDVGDLQAYNRYSYVLNNPLSFTDPSGFKTISDYEKEIEKNKAELAKERAKGEGSLLGALKYAFNPKNWARGAAISDAKDAIAHINEVSSTLEKITDMKIDARQIDDVDPNFKAASDINTAMKVLPGMTTANEASKGNYGAATKEYAKDVALTLVLGKLLGPARGEGKVAEGQIAARIAEAAASGRRELAKRFYQEAGYTAEQTASHMAGIDFAQPVEQLIIPKGTRVVQYQRVGRPQGSYYAPEGTPASALGIEAEGRVANVYTTTRDVRVLRSAAADTTNANVPAAARGSGGGTQYFSPEKEAFEHR